MQKTFPKGRTTYNKLIRDNVPAAMEKRGVRYKVTELDDGKYRKALMEKLFEEAEELRKAESRSEILHELADIFAVLEALAAYEKIGGARLMTVFEQNKKKKGGFNRRFFLHWSEH